MVIVHLSDNQRRIISPVNNETLDKLFTRFCVEYGYAKSEYKFQNLAPDEHVFLDMSIHANRVKEVSLVRLSSGDRKESRDSIYTVIHDTSPRAIPKRPKGPTPTATSQESRASVKPVKRSAPKPPIVIPQPFDHSNESISPDIDIPPPPEFQPTPHENLENNQVSDFYKSIKCGTDNKDDPMVTSAYSSSNGDMLETPDSRENISDIGISLDSTEESEDWERRTEEVSKHITSLDKMNVPCASQESLGSLNIGRDNGSRKGSSNCSSVDDVHDNGKFLGHRKQSSDLGSDLPNFHGDNIKIDGDLDCSLNVSEIIGTALVSMEDKLDDKVAIESVENEERLEASLEEHFEKKHEENVDKKNEENVVMKHAQHIDKKHEAHIDMDLEKHFDNKQQKHEENAHKKDEKHIYQTQHWTGEDKLSQATASNVNICLANKEIEREPQRMDYHIGAESGLVNQQVKRNTDSKPESTTTSAMKNTEAREESRNTDRSDNQLEEFSNRFDDINELDCLDGLPTTQNQAPAAKQYWELPKEGKTMRFLSRTFNTIDVPEEKSIEKKNGPESSEPVVKSVKPVQVIVQEVPVEESDRPTYRPRQTKKLYFTAR